MSIYNPNKNRIDANNAEILAEKLKRRNLIKATIVEDLKTLLQCGDTESSEIYYNYVNGINELETAKRNVKHLLKNKISLETIKENLFLLSMSIGKLIKLEYRMIKSQIKA